MTDNDNKEVVKCPSCEGQGKLRRLELIERQGDGELTSKVEALGAGACQPEEDRELVPAAVGSEPARDFQRDVHRWNPQLPMWRRSSKE